MLPVFVIMQYIKALALLVFKWLVYIFCYQPRLWHGVKYFTSGGFNFNLFNLPAVVGANSVKRGQMAEVVRGFGGFSRIRLFSVSSQTIYE